MLNIFSCVYWPFVHLFPGSFFEGEKNVWACVGISFIIFPFPILVWRKEVSLGKIDG